MDNFLYLAASGATQNMNALGVHANNLANAKSDAFKADMHQARSMQAYGEGLPTRVFAMEERPASNFDSGALKTTGRAMDVAIKGQGWLVVQDGNGGEGLTRAGALRFDETGMLLNNQGRPVLGEAGPIFAPLPIEKVEIAVDGMVTVRPQGAPADGFEEVGQLRLSNPEVANLTKGEDGLFRDLDNDNYPTDITVQLQSGTLEGSNVNPVEEMVGMLAAQRQFDMQIKLMKTAEENDQAGSRMMDV
ncbi:flagellar basal body rod protein FlgF [Ferrimonas lipolytica]|uniref:Flagellar basal-body rod protein FlgF n=1 Tax=Ferrimonas lipolytica TaxID=2724191 RepID=A0A6H1UEJ4_9GAMM|nr:flagellar basal body rod protein FlgF [Ferrimonas lipolytica]QIZ77248.1 flagellar basal body rod protein FlgF [Ferrimonas lipolytica]